MSAILNSAINKLRTEAEAKRVELAELDTEIAALVKIQGGAVSAIPRRRGKPKGTVVPMSAGQPDNDEKLKAFM